MKYRKQSIRVLFFVFLLTCMLTGLAGTMRVPASAAPQMQAAALSVVINEVAWAGTAASSSDEWIELYNP
jgi:multidrug efflux pump subunit AcrB